MRGAHPQDIYGAQMALIAGMLADDAAIGDILAYINTLLIRDGRLHELTYVAHDESEFAPPAEIGEAELYHPKTFIGKYIWSQDAKVIAIQYAVTAIGDRAGRAGVLVADAAAARVSRHASPSSTRATTCSSSPCTG